MSKSDEYVKALEQLDARRAEGKVSEAEYAVWRQRLLAEAGQQDKPYVRIIGWMILGGMLLFFLINLAR